jgi:spore germination protein GerM
MSYEKKIKDLMARLASMSPEPPPYPEETPMARHREASRRRPALVFVGAAILVIALAVPLLMFTGGGEPDLVATTTTTAPATTTTAGVTTTTEPETSTTQAVLPVWSQPGVFLYQSPESSFVGNPALVPVILEVGSLDPDVEFTDALAALGTNLPNGLANAIPAGVSVLSTQMDGEFIVADMNEAFLDGAGGLLADMTMLNQLIYTLTYSSPESTVRFTVNGQPVEAFGSEGLGLSDPVGREDFLDQVHVINLLTPIVETEDGWAIFGIANVFEANLVLNVVDGDGNVTHEEFVTATCGSGCWGEFSAVVDSNLIVPGESSIKLFQNSAEDGSPVDVITIAVPPEGVWRTDLGD